MWDRVLQKLEQLKKIDRQYQAFGAWDHRYSLRPCLSESEVAGVEHTLGVSLPNALRVFYLEVGDGGAGPCYGLNSSAELTGFRSEEAFPGIEEFRQIAASRGRVPPDETVAVINTIHAAVAGFSLVCSRSLCCGMQTCCRDAYERGTPLRGSDTFSLIGNQPATAGTARPYVFTLSVPHRSSVAVHPILCDKCSRVTNDSQ